VAGAWTELTVAVVRNAFPTDLATLYASWVDANPAKANRLNEIIAEVLRTFRTAVEANPANRLDENSDTVPSTGFLHALHTVIFCIGMEMGVQFAPEVYGLNVQANIWLRMVQNGGIPVDTTEGEGSPSYRPSERERWLL
jgi:hypothetical protein